MDSAKFAEGQHLYEAGDYRSAAKTFLAAAGRGTVGNGAAYHMAGNALIRLRRHSDAVTVYGHALRDEMYDKRGAILTNLGTAYVAMGELSKAIEAFETALSEPNYQTPYKAWQGIASAHMERGKVEDAAAAYRKAALDEKNPDPGKALVNLGLCFMALGRPADASEAYKAALGFDAYQGRGRALANLGQAYTAMGEYAEAVRAFEKATQLHAHTLSASAQQAYETARTQAFPPRETIEGWETGEMPPLMPVPDVGSGGWDSGQLASLDAAFAPVETVPTNPAPTYAAPALDDALPSTHGDAASLAARELGFGDEAAVNDFFNRTEEDMKVRAREARRAERGSSGSVWLRRVFLTVFVLLLMGGALALAYGLGLGWPTQTATVKGLLDAYSRGQAVEPYWVAVPKTDVKREMAKVPPVKTFVVDSVERGRDVSKARVTVTPEQGAPLSFSVTLVREGVGWRVNGLDYNWRSTGS